MSRREPLRGRPARHGSARCRVKTAQPAPGVELAIVGHGQLDAVVPFGDIDQRGPFGSDPRGGDYQTGRERPAVLLVNGVDAIARSPALAGTGRTYVWTAPIDPGAIHPWTAAAATTAVEATRAQVTRGNSLRRDLPSDLIATELTRADAARGRLLLIGSLGVAILLAFAVFLALMVRDDIAAEIARLAAVGARRRDRLLFLGLKPRSRPSSGRRWAGSVERSS